MQAQLTNILGHSNSRVSIDSITSFAQSVNTKKAYKKFCKRLFQSGVTAEMINEKESEILSIFNAQNTGISGNIDDSSTEDQSQFPTVSHLYLLIGIY